MRPEGRSSRCCVSAVVTSAVVTIDSTCLKWIRNNDHERPSPVLTTFIHPPAASGGIPAVLGDDGRAITGARVRCRWPTPSTHTSVLSVVQPR